MASQASSKFYESLSEMSPLRAIAESAINGRNQSGNIWRPNVREVYELACSMPNVTVTDRPMDPGTIKKYQLSPDAKILNDNHGRTVGRAAQARRFVNRASAEERNRWLGHAREGVFRMQRNHTRLLQCDVVVGMHPDMMFKARMLTVAEDAAGLFNWLMNFTPLEAVPQYADSKVHHVPDILFIANPCWVPDDPKDPAFQKIGCVLVDEVHKTIFNFGLWYFGEKKKGTLTMAWTAGRDLGAVAAHAGIKEVDFSNCAGHAGLGKRIISFYGLSGSGKSSHTNARDNGGTLPRGFKQTIAHDDAFQIDYKDGRTFVWEPTLFDKTDSRELDDPDWKHCITTQNHLVLETDQGLVPYGRDTRNNNGRALFSRELLGNITNSTGFPHALCWLMKDSCLPPILKLAKIDLAVAMGATLMTKRTAAENVPLEEMKKLVFEPFANPFRVYELYHDCEGYLAVFKAGAECYCFNSGGMWNSSDAVLKKIPLQTSLRLQTALLMKELEWEEWKLLSGAQIPTKQSVNAILPGYYEQYDSGSVQNRNAYVETFQDRFRQRVDYLLNHVEKPDLAQRLADALVVNA